MKAMQKTKKTSTSDNSEPKEHRKKSKFILWREKYPKGLEGTIVNMRAVLR
jgi:hypothetical protein